VNRDGLDALSMRRLADELDAGTMTIYGYFRGKDELLDAMVDVSSARSKRLKELGDGPWREQLRQLILALREALAEHPWEVELRMRRPLASPGAMRVPEAGLQILRGAGLPPAEAARSFRTLFLYTFASRVRRSRRPGARAARNARAAGSAAGDEYPAVSAAVNELTATMAARSSSSSAWTSSSTGSRRSSKKWRSAADPDTIRDAVKAVGEGYSSDGRATTTMKKATTAMKKSKSGSKEGKGGDSPSQLVIRESGS